MARNLTPSQENYLKHIWHLANEGEVRVQDLAAAVGVKLPSVTRAVNNLVSTGILGHKLYGAIEFTPRGYRAAQFIVRRDRCLKRFLVQVLQMSAEKAAAESCRMEHAVSEEVLRRLEVLVDNFTPDTAWGQKLGRQLARTMQDAAPREAVRIGATKPHV